MIDLASRTFDYEKFVSMPKCKNTWTTYSGAGCLLTAFCYALDLPMDGLGTARYLNDINALAEKYLPNKIYTTEGTRILSYVYDFRGPSRASYCTYATTFSDAIVYNYDNENEVLAIQYLFELIEAVWGKKLDATPVKEQVCINV